MKYIKFYLTRGEPITLPEEKAKKVLDADGPLVFISDEEGQWTGETIHKAHIVQTVRDYDAEKEERLRNPRLSEPEIRNGRIENIKLFRPSFLKGVDL